MTVKLRYRQWAGDVFALLLPISYYWPLDQPANPDVLDLYTVPVIYVSDIAVAAFLISGAVWLFQKGRFRWRANTFADYLWFLGGLALVTTPFALDGSLALYTAGRWLVAVAVYLCFLQGDLSPHRFVAVFLSGLLVHVLVAIGQVLNQGPLGLPGELALPLTQPGAAVVALPGGNWLRAYGLTFHPNVLGGYLVAGLILSTPLLFRTSWWLPAWWFLWGGLILTFSRSALLAALVIVPVMVGLLLRKKSRRRRLVVALAGALTIGVAGLALFSEQLAARLSAISTTEWLSVQERLVQIRVAIDILAERPISGVGAGNFPIAILLSGAGFTPLPVHNVPLLLASETGVLAGAIWIWMFIAALATLAGRFHRTNVWAVSGICAWLALWIIGLFDYYPWGLNTGRLLLVTVLGLASHAILDKDFANQ